MNIWRSLVGVVEVELTSAALPEALAAINAQAVEISCLQWENDLTCRFQVRRNQIPKIRVLTEKRGEKLVIRNRLGLFWKLCTIWKRPVLMGGLLIILMLSCILPERILFVRVEGNTLIPDNAVLEAAEPFGVAFGASRRDLRSELVKNGVLSELPGLQWVGVNTIGCVATISVRERTAADTREEYTVSRIIAARDGYILSGTVERGTGMFRPGQTVQKGQLLISGYTDSGFCIRAEQAVGEIIAQTSHEFQAVTPDSCLVRTGKKGTKRKVSILFRKKRINLWKDSGISPVTCDRMYEEYYITLPGGFQLPIALCVETYSCADTEEASLEQTDICRQLQNYSQQYLQHQMVAGKIRSCQEQFGQEAGLFLLRGNYICEEMIGREQQEQIGVTDGKNN